MNANFLPSLFPGAQDPSDDDFNVVGGEVFATFSPWASWLSDGNPFAPTPTTGLPAAAGGSAGGQSDPGSVVAVTSGGITINLIFDTAALAAPASFRAGIQQAVAILAAAISDKITVNLKIDYSGTGGGAAAGPDHGLFESYSSTRADLINGATPGDTTFNALTSGSSIQGQSNVVAWNAQLKLWGLIGANDTTTDDGSATFATDINPNLLVGVALHELTHAMGRVPYGPQPDVFDLFRFTSPGTRLFQNGASAPAAYFSLDGGNTKLADYGRTSDPSDFLNSGVQGSNDPFNEFYNGSTAQHLTAADLKQLDALGFHLIVPDTQAPTISVDNPLSIQAATTQNITPGLLSAGDNVSSGAQLHYTVTTGPTQGTLLLSGSATTSFTQADINNGLVSYHETFVGAASDAFSFKVTDAAGNMTSAASFQINISNSNPFGTTVHDVQNTGGEIYALYDAILDRTPDSLGFEGWVAASEHGMSLHDIANGLLNSTEGQSHFAPTLSNQAFVDQLYESALHRHAESTGLQNWTTLLDNGTSRADVAIGIALSGENVAGMQTALSLGVFVPDADASNVARLYYGLLGRAPDAAGFSGWTDLAKHGSSLSSVALGFLNSSEYQNAHTGQSDTQFIDSLYVDALGRHAESAGIQGWVNALAAGASHADVALDIAESSEAQNHLLSAIEQGWHLA